MGPDKRPSAQNQGFVRIVAHSAETEEATSELQVIHPEQQIFGISAVIFRQRLLGESRIRST
jgi:hypothetical protein